MAATFVPASELTTRLPIDAPCVFADCEAFHPERLELAAKKLRALTRVVTSVCAPSDAVFSSV